MAIDPETGSPAQNRYRLVLLLAGVRRPTDEALPSRIARLVIPTLPANGRLRRKRFEIGNACRGGLEFTNAVLPDAS